MLYLLIFAFISGIVTILSPCILPMLPVLLAGSVDNKSTGYSRPLGIIIGFITSFTFFTLFLSAIVRVLNISGDTMRVLSVIVISIFGISLIVPQLHGLVETFFSKIARNTPQMSQSKGLIGGVLVGISIGILWTPCVGPILASVITLAITGTVTLNTFLLTFAYSLGTAIPMLAIMLGGKKLLNKLPFLMRNTLNIQKVFGIVMIATAIGILFNIDRKTQSIVLTIFPQYGTGLTKLEDNELVKKTLSELYNTQNDSDKIGTPSNNYLQDRSNKAAEIILGGEWFNTEPLTISSLKGKVILIDFWTYSCINCQRTLPYLQTWWEKYKDKGLVIIGIHSPEFEFEKSAKNLAQAIKDFNIQYSVVQDNNFATWKAYNNRYWPAKYFIDKDGYIRSTHFGEGNYDESEKTIQLLLNEINNSPINNEISNLEYINYAQTPELYIGYKRINSLVSPEKIKKDMPQEYTLPKNVPNNKFGLGGSWELKPEFGNPSTNAILELNFNAKDVFLVMRNRGKVSKVKVYVDGELKYFGKDNIEGIVTIDADKLYNLVTLPTPGNHVLKLEFLDNDTEVYAFTFG